MLRLRGTWPALWRSRAVVHYRPFSTLYLRSWRPRPLLSREYSLHHQQQYHQLLRRVSCREASNSAFDRSQKTSPITWTSLLVLVVGGGVAVAYVKHLKTLKEKEAEEKKVRSHGKAALGGPFSLLDHNGERKKEQRLLWPVASHLLRLHLLPRRVPRGT
jgi:hypothetical protein